MKKLGILIRKAREFIGLFLKKQLFIMTELVVKLARVYFDSQVFIIDLQFFRK